MSQRRTCPECGGKFIAEGDERFCPTDRKWSDRQQRTEAVMGRAKSVKVVAAPASPAMGTKGAVRSMTEVVESAVPAATAFSNRHPSARPRLVVVDDLCPHGQPALTCEGCIRTSELDWESREEA